MVNLNLSAGASFESTSSMAFSSVIGKYSTRENWALLRFTAPVSGFRVSAGKHRSQVNEREGGGAQH
jgi:hypothetical protein